MILELALDSGATLVAYKSGSLLFHLAKANWYKSRGFRRLFWTKKRWQREYADFRERVIKLEVDTGVGLSNDSKEWLNNNVKNMRIKATPGYLQKLALDGNGHVEVVCNKCSQVYQPHNDYPNFYAVKNHERSVQQVLCPACKRGYEVLKKSYGIKL